MNELQSSYNIVEIMKKSDNAINKQKASVKRIRVGFIIANIVVTLIVVTVVFIRWKYTIKGLFLVAILEFVMGIALIFSVFHMRRTIQ